MIDDLTLPETLASYLADHITVTASGRVQPSGKLDVGILETDEVMVNATRRLPRRSNNSLYCGSIMARKLSFPMSLKVPLTIRLP